MPEACSKPNTDQIIVSHDRRFLDRIATRILAFEGDSRVESFEDHLKEDEAERRRRLGAHALEPQRSNYKTIKIRSSKSICRLNSPVEKIR